jgi:hypothetical protein
MRTPPLLLLTVLALAACGSSGGPAIDGTVATKLARQADAVAAAGNPCTARNRARTLQAETIAAINAGRIPTAYLEPLQGRVNEIVSELELRCLPTPAPSSTAPPPAPVVVLPSEQKSHDRHGHDGRGHGHGHGKGD